jgi:hypothetical protein
MWSSRICSVAAPWPWPVVGCGVGWGSIAGRGSPGVGPGWRGVAGGLLPDRVRGPDLAGAGWWGWVVLAVALLAVALERQLGVVRASMLPLGIRRSACHGAQWLLLLRTDRLAGLVP